MLQFILGQLILNGFGMDLLKKVCKVSGKVKLPYHELSIQFIPLICYVFPHSKFILNSYNLAHTTKIMFPLVLKEMMEKILGSDCVFKVDVDNKITRYQAFRDDCFVSCSCSFEGNMLRDIRLTMRGNYYSFRGTLTFEDICDFVFFDKDLKLEMVDRNEIEFPPFQFQISILTSYLENISKDYHHVILNGSMIRSYGHIIQRCDLHDQVVKKYLATPWTEVLEFYFIEY